MIRRYGKPRGTDVYRRRLLQGLLGTAVLGRTSGLIGQVRRMDEAMTLLLTGDVMTGRGIDQILRHSLDPVLYEPYVRSAQRYVEIAETVNGEIPRDVGPDYIWGDALAVMDEIAPAARVINLETALTTSDQPWPGKGIHYRMHPRNVDVLLAAGIDCCVLANNHVLDWGRPGLEETLATLKGGDLAYAGAGMDADAAASAAILKPHNGPRVLVFAVAEPQSGVLPTWSAGEHRSGVNLVSEVSAESAKRIAATIAATRRPGDRVVVSIHWGGNWGYPIQDAHRAFAHALVDAGAADIVHGHSSHHPKGMEIYERKLILYGCGDLINDYEGIGGHEHYRPDLSVLYFPTIAAETGDLTSLLLAPMQIRRFRLNRSTVADAEWLAGRLNRETGGGSFSVDRDGRLRLSR